jgi:hypothetical protein
MRMEETIGTRINADRADGVAAHAGGGRAPGADGGAPMHVGVPEVVDISLLLLDRVRASADPA